MYKFTGSPENNSKIDAEIPEGNYLCYIYGHSTSVPVNYGAIWIFGLMDYNQHQNTSHGVQAKKFKLVGDENTAIELSSLPDFMINIKINSNYAYPVAILLNVSY